LLFRQVAAGGFSPTFGPPQVISSRAGNTATYSALRSAYRLAAKQTADRSGALTTIVLMTDGETNGGITAGQFRAYYRDLPRPVRAVPTFTVKFGTADPRHWAQPPTSPVASSSRPRTIHLADAFKEIRGYQ
jgi:Ca-activated chloride channel homolog